MATLLWVIYGLGILATGVALSMRMWKRKAGKDKGKHALMLVIGQYALLALLFLPGLQFVLGGSPSGVMFLNNIAAVVGVTGMCFFLWQFLGTSRWRFAAPFIAFLFTAWVYKGGLVSMGSWLSSPTALTIPASPTAPAPTSTSASTSGGTSSGSSSSRKAQACREGRLPAYRCK